MKLTKEEKEDLLQFMNFGVFNMMGKDILKHTVLIQKIAMAEIEDSSCSDNIPLSEDDQEDKKDSQTVQRSKQSNQDTVPKS